MQGEENLKIVEFFGKCSTCKNENVKSGNPDFPENEKCHECLNTPVREYSHTPLYYEKK